MRNLLIVACIFGLAILPATAGEKCCPKEKGKQQKKVECPIKKLGKDVKVEVTYIENGAIVKVISDKPEVVKKIQEWTRGFGHERIEKVTDPVCGTEIEKDKALKADYEGRTYYFCAQHCKDSFLKESEKYIKK